MIHRRLFSLLIVLSLGCVGDPRVLATDTVRLAAGDADSFEVRHGPGRLDVVGEPDLDEVVLEATLVALWTGDADDRATEAFDVSLERREGRIVASVEDLPDGYVVDLVARVPAEFAADVEDGDGEVIVSDLASVRLVDGNGTAEVTRITGDVWVDDGDGELFIDRVGAVTVTDGSGALEILDAAGPVEVVDGDGELRIERVSGDVTVDDGDGELACVDIDGSVEIRDGNGSILLERVAGVARVTDGDGDIVANDVGELIVVSDGNGDVEIR